VTVETGYRHVPTGVHGDELSRNRDVAGDVDAACSASIESGEEPQP